MRNDYIQEVNLFDRYHKSFYIEQNQAIVVTARNWIIACIINQSTHYKQSFKFKNWTMNSIIFEKLQWLEVDFEPVQNFLVRLVC